MYVYYQCVVYFCMFSCCCLAPRTPFSISYKASLIAMNYLSFCLSRKVFISLSYLKNKFAIYSILGWKIFFQNLNMSFHSLLAYRVSSEKTSSSPFSFYGIPIILLFGFLMASYRSLGFSPLSLPSPFFSCNWAIQNSYPLTYLFCFPFVVLYCRCFLLHFSFHRLIFFRSRISAFFKNDFYIFDKYII